MSAGDLINLLTNGESAGTIFWFKFYMILSRSRYIISAPCYL
jgi:hypothetical protein